MEITEEFVLAEDEKLIEAGVPLHARPMRVVLAYVQADSVMGDVFAQLWDPVMAFYRRLYPSGDFGIPPLLEGGVGFRDRFYVARVFLGYGEVGIDPLQCIVMGKAELDIWHQRAPDQVWRAMYAVADLWDFRYAVDDLRGEPAKVQDQFVNAGSAISSTAAVLANGGDGGMAAQTAFLAAELAMKGVLARCGWSDKRRRGLGHALPQMAAGLVQEIPRSSDARLIRAAAEFPDLVTSRYRSHGLSRMDLIELAMRSQFIAADALRRVSARDMADTIENSPDAIPREFP